MRSKEEFKELIVDILDVYNNWGDIIDLPEIDGFGAHKKDFLYTCITKDLVFVVQPYSVLIFKIESMDEYLGWINNNIDKRMIDETYGFEITYTEKDEAIRALNELFVEF